MPKKCYCKIITEKEVIIKECKSELPFSLAEMEKWQREKYEKIGEKVNKVKCTLKKPTLF